MPKHMEETKKWELFIQTAVGSNGITVVSVNSEDVRFTINDPSILDRLNLALSNPIHLRHNVIHSLPRHGSSDEESVMLNMGETEGSALLPKLVSQEFLALHGINVEGFITDFRGISELNVGALNALQYRQLVLNVEFVQSALSNVDRMVEIFLNNAGPVEREDEQGEIAEFSKSILWLKPSSDNTYTIMFNSNLLLQAIQIHPGFRGGNNFAPVVALVDGVGDDEGVQVFSINRGALLENIHDAIGSDVIFSEAGNNQLQPIMFHPNEVKTNTKQDTLFHILIDISESMEFSFSTYQNNIKNIIRQIIQQNDNYKMVITTFNCKIDSKTFESGPQTQEQIELLISSLRADGGTNLHGAIVKSVESIMRENSDYENSVLILCTDGTDGDKSYTGDQVAKIVSDARDQSSQFSMFTMGFGTCYNAVFFEYISSQSGFTHMHLDNVQEINQFYQYIATLGNAKYIYQFVSEAKQYMEQCAANDLAVASHLINKNGYVSYNGEKHVIGVDHPDTINGFKVVDAGGEGNCLFLAIEQQLKGTQYSNLSFEELREMAAVQVAQNPDRYYGDREARADEVLNDVTRMFNNGEFADNVLIQGLSDALGVRINIHHADGHIVTIDREGENYQDLGINILYHNIHYLSLEEQSEINEESGSDTSSSTEESQTSEESGSIDYSGIDDSTAAAYSVVIMGELIDYFFGTSYFH